MPSTATPPRRRRSTLAFAEGQAEPLHHELELALLFGRGSKGLPPVELQCLDDWRRVWGEYRDLLEPKARDYLPGRRAFARYVVGELEPPPVLVEPPRSHTWFRVWIHGTGRFWTQYPEPWQRNETEWLVELGEVGQQEYRQWVEQRSRPRDVRRVFGVWRLLGDYPLEVGRYS